MQFISCVCVYYRGTQINQIVMQTIFNSAGIPSQIFGFASRRRSRTNSIELVHPRKIRSSTYIETISKLLNSTWWRRAWIEWEPDGKRKDYLAYLPSTIITFISFISTTILDNQIEIYITIQESISIIEIFKDISRTMVNSFIFNSNVNNRT